MNSLIQTQTGPVLGHDDEESTLAWLGVPFAKPPCGDLRWCAPQTPAVWDAPFVADKYGSLAPQIFIMGESHETNEDCLSLNVWRPKNDQVNLPVYVWIHGGGNFVALPPVCDTPGARTANREQVVFVSFNYRLAEFGWLAHPSLRTGDAANDSGNFGTLDMIKVLQWVQDNIEQFGGDKNNVLITGESAGGMDVLSLINSPMATGLFHKAMVQSGNQSYVTMEDAEAHAERILEKLLVNDKTVADREAAKKHIAQLEMPAIANYLRSKSYQEIASAKGANQFSFNIQDGYVIHEEGAKAFETGVYPNKVPIILGSCAEETKVFAFMLPQFQGKDEFYQLAMRYAGDMWKVSGCDSIARNLIKHQDNVWAFHFCWGALDDSGKSVINSEFGLKIGAAHTMDIPFLFGLDEFVVKFITNKIFTEENRQGREKLSQAMMSYMTHFIYTGNPNGDSAIPEWYEWSNEKGGPKSLIFDADEQDLKIEMMSKEYSKEEIEAKLEDSPFKDDIAKMKRAFAKMGMSALIN